MFSHNFFKIQVHALLVSLVCLPGSVFATAAEDIAKANEATAVQAAQLAELEMRAKVLAKQFEVDVSSKRVVPGSTASASPGSGTAASSSTLPTVRSIEGAEGKLSALLVTDKISGATVRVSKGSKVGKWTVANIEGDTVTLSRKVAGKKDDEVERLVFVSEPTVTPATPAALPPVPPAPYPAR